MRREVSVRNCARFVHVTAGHIENVTWRQDYVVCFVSLTQLLHSHWTIVVLATLLLVRWQGLHRFEQHPSLVALQLQDEHILPVIMSWNSNGSTFSSHIKEFRNCAKPGAGRYDCSKSLVADTRKQLLDARALALTSSQANETVSG